MEHLLVAGEGISCLRSKPVFSQDRTPLGQDVSILHVFVKPMLTHSCNKALCSRLGDQDCHSGSAFRELVWQLQSVSQRYRDTSG